jgi:hypothetical protein
MLTKQTKAALTKLTGLMDTTKALTHTGIMGKRQSKYFYVFPSLFFVRLRNICTRNLSYDYRNQIWLWLYGFQKRKKQNASHEAQKKC